MRDYSERRKVNQRIEGQKVGKEVRREKTNRDGEEAGE